MLRQQEEGVYPAAFAAIHEPVIMLHGDYDSHPGSMIRASLEPHLPQLEYREWKRCGHYPWIEMAVHDEFFVVLRMACLAIHQGSTRGLYMMTPAHVSQMVRVTKVRSLPLRCHRWRGHAVRLRPEAVGGHRIQSGNQTSYLIMNIFQGMGAANEEHY